MTVLVLVLCYRAAMAILLEAFHALPSLQRRRLLEEDAIANPLLARLLAKPHVLGLALSLWNQALLVLLLSSPDDGGHLQALAALSRRLRDPPTAASMRKAPNGAAARDILLSA